jgi:uncharacterized membrane protein YeaQ/YmgE (transglycosylase-associated protein family)
MLMGPPAMTLCGVACEIPAMDMGLIGWIVVGFIAGSISSWVVRTRTAQGCLPTILVGIVGGVIGGWLSRQMGLGDVEGFIAAILFATVGAIIVRFTLRAIEGRP